MWGTRKLLPILVGDQHSRKLYGEKILNIYIKLHIKCLLSNLGNKKIFVNFEEQNSCVCGQQNSVPKFLSLYTNEQNSR